MSEVDIKNIGLKVGLEIHQQLDTKKKLFCDCTPIEEEEFSRKFSRKLRDSIENINNLEEIPPISMFERSTNVDERNIMYATKRLLTHPSNSKMLVVLSDGMTRGSLNDLKNYKAKKREPICGKYREYKICSAAPPSAGGFSILQILGILEEFNLSKDKIEKIGGKVLSNKILYGKHPISTLEESDDIRRKGRHGIGGLC